jgi:glutathione S-transferase
VKLYTSLMSSSARRVNLTVAHLGIAIDQKLIDLRSQVDRAELAAVNPNAKVPALADPASGLALWESHAIMQYLCDRNPASGAELYPTDVVVRADINRWMFWVNAHLGPAIGPINYEKMWKKFVEGPAALPDAEQIARHERAVHQVMAVLDKHLEARNWVVGKTVTLADYSIVATLMYRVPTQLPLDAYQHVMAYVARVEALDAWKTTEPTSSFGEVTSRKVKMS